MVIDFREEDENTSDSMCLNSESVSDEIDESDLLPERHDEERIRT
jgi:hypothetical protein